MTVAMIQAGALGNVPEVMAAEVGWRAVDNVFCNFGLTASVASRPESLIPWSAVMSIVETGARAAGDEDFGLELCKFTTIDTYGTWGKYVTSAPTLGDALHRVESTIVYHSPGTYVKLDPVAGGIRLTYRLALFGAVGTINTSYCAANVLIGVVQHFLGPSWRPHRLCLSVTRDRPEYRIANTFGCDVRQGGETISFVIPADLLSAPAFLNQGRVVTIGDVERARRWQPAATFKEAVLNVLWIQLLDGPLSVDRLCQTLGIGRRTLQRRLQTEGIDYRHLERHVMLTRASELLAERSMKITQIAMELNYESSSHFSRAFSSATGMPPKDYRKMLIARKAALPPARA